MKVGIPEFPSNKDRIVYLLAEFKYIIATFTGTAVVAAIHFGLVDMPDWLAALITAVVVFSVTGYPVALKIVDWLYDPRGVTVYEINSYNDVVEKWDVPPDIWREKEVEGKGGPWTVNDNDWAVRDLDWREDTGQLVVEGVWLDGLEDDKLITSKTHMERMYEFLEGQYIRFGRVRARIGEMAGQIQEASIKEMAETKEEVEMVAEDAVQDAYEDAEDDVSFGEEDMPVIGEEDVPEHVTPDPEHSPRVDDAGGGEE
ncbi:MAG: phage holin family protein [Halorientalis sp.]